MSFKPTQEQELAVEMFLSQRDTVVEAGAGTGKTSTLKLMAEAAPGLRGQYTAFNKAIVVDSKDKFPSSVKCNTAHSLAWWGIGKNYADRLNSSGRIKSHEIARRLRIEDIDIVVAEEARKIPGPFMAGHIMQAVTHFCQSADLEPSVRHFSYIPGIDEHTEDGKRGYTNNNIVQGYMLDYLVKAWQDLSLFDGQGGQLPFKHEHYLKAWQLNGPVIDADYILFDEAQDANPVMLACILAQKNAQKILVGDSCQPTGTLVTVVTTTKKGNRHIGVTPTQYAQTPIEQVQPGDTVISYDIPHSFFRRTGSKVIGVSSRHYEGDLIAIQTENGLRSSYTPDHHCIVRIGEAFRGKHLVYMMRKGNSYRIGKVTGQYETQHGAFGLEMRSNSEKADAAWILSAHDTNEDALYAEIMTAYKWNIPTMTFVAQRSHALGQSGIDAFWQEVGNNEDRAKACLEAHGRDIQFPFWAPKNGNAMQRRAFVIRATNLMDGMAVLSMANALSSNGKRVVKKKYETITVSRQPYSGLVWSMTVENDHTYVGDGIITHNCQQIYEWTGAVNALQNTGIKNKVFLSQSFRFGPAIATMANKVLTVLGAELRLRGLESIDSRVDYVDRPDCYLTRTNATAVRRLLVELAQGQRPHLMGGGKDVMSFAEGAQKLKSGMSSEHPDLACFASWTEVQEYVNHDPQGDELRLLVKLVDDFGPYEIIQAIRGMSSEDRASIVISTAHKAKGREWHSVELGDDFPTPKEGEGLPGDEELRLLYVAITRASHVLDISGCKLAQAIACDVSAADETDETDEMSDETSFVDDPITIVSKSERDYDPDTMVFQQMMFGF